MIHVEYKYAYGDRVEPGGEVDFILKSSEYTGSVIEAVWATYQFLVLAHVAEEPRSRTEDGLVHLVCCGAALDCQVGVISGFVEPYIRRYVSRGSAGSVSGEVHIIDCSVRQRDSPFEAIHDLFRRGHRGR
jgi:hypothetical protein